MDPLLLLIVCLFLFMCAWTIIGFGVGIDAKGQLISNEKIAHKVMGVLVVLLSISCFCKGATWMYVIIIGS